MYDIVIRNCGAAGWLGILQTLDGKEMWRQGTHARTVIDAFNAARAAWDSMATANIKAFKEGKEF